jgi:hypothetical protein
LLKNNYRFFSQKGIVLSGFAPKYPWAFRGYICVHNDLQHFEQVRKARFIVNKTSFTRCNESSIEIEFRLQDDGRVNFDNYFQRFNIFEKSL